MILWWLNEKIYGNKENTEVSGETLKTYKMTLTIDSKNRDRVAENFINTLKVLMMSLLEFWLR